MGGSSADALYDFEEEAVLREELRESMRDATEREMVLLAMWSFR
jgi:hypothetical protein